MLDEVVDEELDVELDDEVDDELDDELEVVLCVGIETATAVFVVPIETSSVSFMTFTFKESESLESKVIRIFLVIICSAHTFFSFIRK